MSGEETFASGHRKMTNPFEKCARLQARVAELEAKHDRTQAAIELIEAAGWLWFVGNTSDVWRDGSKLIRALVGTKENPLGEAEAATAAEALELAYTRAALQRDRRPG